LARIIRQKDKATLEREYQSVFGNIDISFIEDEEVIDALQTLADTVHTMRLNDIERALVFERERQRVNSSIARQVSFTNLQHFVRAAHGDPLALSHSLGSVAAIAKEILVKPGALETGEWLLERQDLEALHVARSDFFRSYWTVLRRYHLEDQYRITEAEFDEVFRIVEDADSSRRQRRLEAFLDRTSAFPPIAFYAGVAAAEAGDQASAAKHLKLYKSFWQPVLRQDDLYAATLVDIYRREGGLLNNHEINTMLKHGRDNGAVQLYAAVALVESGERARAEQVLLSNIDRDLAPTASRRVLAALSTDKLKQFRDLVDDVAESDDYTILESALLASFRPDHYVLGKVEEQLNRVSLDYEESVWGNRLSIQLPQRIGQDGHVWAELQLDVAEFSALGVYSASTVSIARVDFNVTLDDAADTITASASLRFPIGEAKLVFTGFLAHERDTRWSTSAWETTKSASRKEIFGVGLPESLRAGNEASGEEPTLLVRRFVLSRLEFAGACYARGIDGHLAACTSN
jgi:hypothetical protein